MIDMNILRTIIFILSLPSFAFDGNCQCVSGDCENGFGKYIYREGIYEGDWQNGKWHGNGKRTLNNGFYKKGIWESGKFIEGQVREKLNDGIIYEGSIFSEKPHGNGKMTYPDGSYYKGTFNNSIPEGKGELKQSDGSFYSGGFLNGMRHGYGKQTYSDGSTYSGNWHEDKCQGKGVWMSKNGLTKYKGDFFNDEFNGFGVWENEAGDTYEGEFRNGQRHGKGKLKNKSGESCSGDWKNGEPYGIDTIITAEYKYIGQVENWVKKGVGEIWKKDGTHYKGEWEHDDYNGKGVRTEPNGRTLSCLTTTGNFVDGCQVGVFIDCAPNESTCQECEWKDCQTRVLPCRLIKKIK